MNLSNLYYLFKNSKIQSKVITELRKTQKQEIKRKK